MGEMQIMIDDLVVFAPYEGALSDFIQHGYGSLLSTANSSPSQDPIMEIRCIEIRRYAYECLLH
jgi:hypothetical protein